ncbi:MAG TPA: sulfurtransferase TusA family protein [Candidatus Lokiarchaeia archaeon]|nr:sulfurtransferase TusA family protein [Candidatus Lokiarchaeia archaeon]
MTDIELNAIGKKCPMPVLMAKKELAKLDSGDVLTVLADDAGALKDIPALIRKTEGYEIIDSSQEGKQITIKIQKS